MSACPCCPQGISFSCFVTAGGFLLLWDTDRQFVPSHCQPDPNVYRHQTLLSFDLPIYSLSVSDGHWNTGSVSCNLCPRLLFVSVFKSFNKLNKLVFWMHMLYKNVLTSSSWRLHWNVMSSECSIRPFAKIFTDMYPVTEQYWSSIYYLTILFRLAPRQPCHTWPWGFPVSTPAWCPLEKQL